MNISAVKQAHRKYKYNSISIAMLRTKDVIDRNDTNIANVC